MSTIGSIDGVSVKNLVRHADDRGFFCEVLKAGEPSAISVRQTSYTETHPGIIKAFHWHRKQWDSWFVVGGSAQVVLHDLRDGSPTKGTTQVIYAGSETPRLISIPPGVAHGYRVLGTERVRLFYHTSEAYDPTEPDEERVPHDDAGIGFDWNTKNR
ncbi:dTDP-4-dehydrorhamnose 3,5-epimerase family protein [Patescibacteria group bacterium]|nr:dTDP-4-dehydrorhamnose 3,5-epimerase family protein [Patescibacteria group bacterium]MBU1448416.1 dTDP-4-dehydrorhamnose 3,5-epimerase family protein [Patescibacteria group bacterium]MBU2613660.1 dTDP-4-dehydrorhamnose 3,5-epimerase family protein [Patescibacteria group bacterium]